MMKAIRLGICALVGFAVWGLGGVEPWGQAILELGAAVLFVLWGVRAVRQRQVEVHGNWLYLPLLGLGVLALVQNAAVLSVYPYLTKIELLQWGAYALLFFLAFESFRTVVCAKQFVWFLIVLGFCVALFGILQHFTFNGKLYWFVSLPSGAAPFGPYVNRDDFAGFVELTAPLGLALLLFRARRREHLVLLGLFTIVPLGALILCASRGGIIGFLFECTLLLLLSRARKIGWRQITGLAALALVAGSFLLWLGVSPAIERFEELTHERMSRDLRLSLYRDTWRIFVHHPWAGTGLGTFPAVYPGYASVYAGLRVNHAHNDYLELLADTGLAGAACGLSFIFLLLWQGLGSFRAARDRLDRAILAGSFSACAGLLVHSVVDFNLHIPSNALLFLLLASLLHPREQAQARRRHKLGRKSTFLFSSSANETPVPLTLSAGLCKHQHSPTLPDQPGQAHTLD